MYDTENLPDENVMSASGATEQSVQDQQQPEQPQQEVAEQPTPKAEQAKNDVENNLRALREKSQRIERERDDYMNRLRDLEARANPKPPEEDLSLNIGETDLAEGRHVYKLEKKIKRQEEELRKTQEQTRQLLIETRLQVEHPDIAKVVTEDNIKALGEMYPEVAATLNSSSDYYSKAKAAYTMIKKFGIAQEDSYAAERDTVAKNAAKPRPLTSVSPQQAESPLSRVNAFDRGLTPELMTQLRKEMEEAVRNR